MQQILISKLAYKKYAAELSSLGFEPISLPADERLNKTVSTHADTLIYTDGKVCISNNDYIKALPTKTQGHIIGVSEFPHGDYPTDAIFNALCVGKLIFARMTSLSEAVKASAKSAGYTIIDVKQGYAKCSTLAIPRKNAAITADSGMAKAMEKHGVSVLKISPGHIALDGCEYGFIGGASFVCERSETVYFFGDVTAHPDTEKVVPFIKDAGYSVYSLTGKLTDFGGAVII